MVGSSNRVVVSVRGTIGGSNKIVVSVRGMISSNRLVGC